MSVRDWLDRLAETQELDLLTADGYDAAIVGVAQRFNETFVVYDRAIVLRLLTEEGMTGEEAEEYFDFNIVGSWVGPSTPAYLTRPEPDDGH